MVTVALGPIFVIWYNAEAILLLLKQEPEVARLADLYLKWLSIGLPAYSFNCIIRFVETVGVSRKADSTCIQAILSIAGHIQRSDSNCYGCRSYQHPAQLYSR